MIRQEKTAHSRLKIRWMEERDLEAALRLSATAGWNQTVVDWQLFLRNSPAGCFVAVHGEQVVGTVATITYGEIAWIGMMLVDVSFQRMGIGRMLMEQALESLADVPFVKLDATPAGQPLYEKLGFVVEDELHRWTRDAASAQNVLPVPDLHRTALIEPDDLQEVAQCDRQAFGAPRPGVLEALRDAAPAVARQCLQEGSLQAFALGRPGCRFHQIGPVVATQQAAAQEVTAAALHALPDCPVVMDVPITQTAYSQWLGEQGFVRQRPFRRMVRNATLHSISLQLFAIAGPELG